MTEWSKVFVLKTNVFLTPQVQILLFLNSFGGMVDAIDLKSIFVKSIGSSPIKNKVYSSNGESIRLINERLMVQFHLYLNAKKKISNKI